MMFLKAPAVSKIRLVDAMDKPLKTAVDDSSESCRTCGKPMTKVEPLYAEFHQFALVRASDTKLAQKLNGAEHAELVMRLRAVLKKGPEQGVYVFETTDGKKLREAWLDPTDGYDPKMIHNFAEWIQLGAEMSEKDPRSIMRQDSEPVALAESKDQ
jgi:hypothetical protein